MSNISSNLDQGRLGAREPRSVNPRLLAAAVGLAWLGLVIHNAVEFPHLPMWRLANSGPAFAWLSLLLSWVFFPRHWWPGTLLFGWGVISLAGAVATVLPLPVLPFQPEQSLRHYAVHAVYAASQLPVLWLMWKPLVLKDEEARSG